MVVPLSTLENWEREFAAWASHLNIVKFHGRQSARDVIRQHEFFMPGSKKDNLQVWGLANDIDFPALSKLRVADCCCHHATAGALIAAGEGPCY